jgi:hypothetical protein
MQPCALLALLVVVATALFVVGVSVEKTSGDSHDEPAAAQHGGAAESGEGNPGEAGEAGEGGEVRARETGEAGEAHTEAGVGEPTGGADETLLGVDLEATGFVVLAAALSLALAAAVWLRPEWRWVLAVAFVVMLGFAALDVREVGHQLDEDDGGLALLAGVVAALHLGAAGMALRIGRAPASPERGAVA